MINQFLGRPLDPFQQKAIAYLEEGHSVIVSAPTGTGKTLIADFLVCHMRKQNKNIIFTAPIKALSNQKYRDYTKLIGEENVGLVTGDIVINQNAPVLIMTTEVLRNLFLQDHISKIDIYSDQENPILTASSINTDKIHSLGAVIIDEIHFFGDSERGTVWEELLIYLPHSVQLLGLSATLSNIDTFANWLAHIRRQPVKVVKENKRAVPLKFFLANRIAGCLPVPAFHTAYREWRLKKRRPESAYYDFATKSFKNGISKNKKPKASTKKEKNQIKSKLPPIRNSMLWQFQKSKHLDVIRCLDESAFPALYFIFSRKQTESLAYELGRSDIRIPLSKKHQMALYDKIDAFKMENPGLLHTALEILLLQGIAFHHAGVHVLIKSLVEDLYENRLLNILYCTTTFALGINMPARTVIFDCLHIYNSTQLVPLEQRDFMQMAGRAGRRGIDVEGQVIVKMDFEQWLEEHDSFVKLIEPNCVDPIESTFNLSFNSVLHIATVYTPTEAKSLLFRCFKDYKRTQKIQELKKRKATIKSIKKQESIQQEIQQNSHSLSHMQYVRKIDFLRAYNYIEKDNSLCPRGKVCLHIQYKEILVTELYMAGLFENVSSERVFGILTGLVQTIPKDAHVDRSLLKDWDDIIKTITIVTNQKAVKKAESILGVSFNVCIPIMPLGEMWAQGYPLAVIQDCISCDTDLSGDLIGAFRRAKDLMNQLKAVVYYDPSLCEDYIRVLEIVTRDEVEVIG